MVAEDITGAPETVSALDYGYFSVYDYDESEGITTEPAAPASVLDDFPDGRVALSGAQDPWFLSVQEVRRPCMASPPFPTHCWPTGRLQLASGVHCISVSLASCCLMCI